MNSRELVYSSFHLWNIAADSAKRAREIKAMHPKACTTDAISAVLLSAMSTEAFINELGTRLALLLDAELTDSRKWNSIGEVFEQLEKERAQIKTKYLIGSQLLPGPALNKGMPPFQDFSRLIDMRNDFAHPKVLESPPKYIDYFNKKGWLYNKLDDEPKLVGWLNQLETPEIAAWACRAALGVISDIVERFSSVSNPQITFIYSTMKLHWDRASGDPRIVI